MPMAGLTGGSRASKICLLLIYLLVDRSPSHIRSKRSFFAINIFHISYTAGELLPDKWLLLRPRREKPYRLVLPVSS